MNELIPDRARLEKRLKKLGEKELAKARKWPFYSSTTANPYTCPVCGTTTWHNINYSSSLSDIRETVAEIKQLGYDAVLDEHELCANCGHVDDMECFTFVNGCTLLSGKKLIFKIRFSSDEDYHIAKSNEYEDYQTVLFFLTNTDSLAIRTTTHSIDDISDAVVLHDMLGIDTGMDDTSYYYSCPICGATTRYQLSDKVQNVLKIRSIVTEIRQLGYDAILDEHELCDNCCMADNENVRGKEFNERKLIFKIRFSPEEDYHTVTSGRDDEDDEELQDFFNMIISITR
jgi:rubrerythrin